MIFGICYIWMIKCHKITLEFIKPGEIMEDHAYSAKYAHLVMFQ